MKDFVTGLYFVGYREPMSLLVPHQIRKHRHEYLPRTCQCVYDEICLRRWRAKQPGHQFQPSLAFRYWVA